jgi:hypothetical protein
MRDRSAEPPIHHHGCCRHAIVLGERMPSETNVRFLGCSRPLDGQNRVQLSYGRQAKPQRQCIGQYSKGNRYRCGKRSRAGRRSARRNAVTCEVREKREIAQKRQAPSAKASEESPEEGRCAKLSERLTNRRRSRLSTASARFRRGPQGWRQGKASLRICKKVESWLQSDGQTRDRPDQTEALQWKRGSRIACWNDQNC